MTALSISNAETNSTSVIEVAIRRDHDHGSHGTIFEVEVVRSAAGEGRAAVDLDIADLTAQSEEFRKLLGVTAGRFDGAARDDERKLRRMGRQLFTALLGTGEVAERYRSAVDLARVNEQPLRVVVRIDSPLLAGLPWEAMYDPRTGAYLCHDNPLVRQIPVPAPPAPLQVSPPLRILGVVSAPGGLLPLDADRERAQLEKALAVPARQGLVEIRWARTATWEHLQEQLMAECWHVLHYIGHGEFDADRDEGTLLLEREDGTTHRISATRLAALLSQARPMPRLAVLSSCSGGTVGTDLFSGTAACLVRKGVSAAVAMQYPVSDAAAIAFARGFYVAVARGRGIDEAVTAGRVAVLGVDETGPEWVTPVLYLRGSQTRLYTVPRAPSPDPRTPGRNSH